MKPMTLPNHPSAEGTPGIQYESAGFAVSSAQKHGTLSDKN